MKNIFGSTSDCHFSLYNREKSINAVLFWTALICRGLLSIMYLAVLVRVRLGSKYALVTLLIILLFISAAAGTELTIAWNVFQECPNVNHLLVQEVCFSMKQLFFNLSHWILACHYN